MSPHNRASRGFSFVNHTDIGVSDIRSFEPILGISARKIIRPMQKPLPEEVFPIVF